MKASYHHETFAEPAHEGECAELRAEIGDLHKRIDGLLEAVESIAHDHYRPLWLPEAKVLAALHKARRTRAIATVRLRD